MYALINKLTLFCNMQLNVLNNLAEAMKALDGKKSVERPGESQEALDGKKIAGLICRCQNKIISWLACTKGLHCQLWWWCYSSLEAQEETLPILKAGDPGWIPNGLETAVCPIGSPALKKL